MKYVIVMCYTDRIYIELKFYKITEVYNTLGWEVL